MCVEISLKNFKVYRSVLFLNSIETNIYYMLYAWDVRVFENFH